MEVADVCVYENAEERKEVFKYLDGLPVEYHKPYKRFNKTVKVPRGPPRRIRITVPSNI